MTFSQFDLSKALRCSTTDAAGYSCVLAPSHSGGHRWNRCEWTDSEGHRCMLQPRHAGGHEMPWYDSPATPGQTHTLSYDGSIQGTEVLASTMTEIAGRHGWVRLSQTFRPGLLWRSPALAAWLSSVTKPQGRLTIVFEYRPPDGADRPKSE
ncbi:MAG TPA: hypothetical protein VF337_05145 [Candidatus Limnocylindrales bacterium]